jgi:hypothetical protein
MNPPYLKHVCGQTAIADLAGCRVMEQHTTRAGANNKWKKAESGNVFLLRSASARSERPQRRTGPTKKPPEGGFQFLLGGPGRNGRAEPYFVDSTSTVTEYGAKL